MEDDRLGPLVAGTKEELSFATTAHGSLSRRRLCAAGRLQELVDLRRQQLGLSGSGGPADTGKKRAQSEAEWLRGRATR